MSGGPALRLREVAVRFGAGPGLEGLSVAVEPGERLALVGPSGAGKTTLLRAVAGLAPVAAGTVEIAGRECTALPPERRDAVYLHQTPLLFPHLDVFENVAFPLRVRGVAEPGLGARVAGALASVRMQGFERRAPRTLSGGQRHRVALARAIVARPAVLLLDEPLAALDPALREEVRGAIVAVQAEYRPAIVLVTHDLEEAGLLADRVGILLGGRLAQVDPPERLFLHPASLAVARFLGLPNEVSGRVDEHGRFLSALGPLSPPDPPVPGPAVAIFPGHALRAHAAGAVVGRVRGLRHRPAGTTAVVEIDGLILEAAVDPLAPPAVGAEVTLWIEERLVRVFSVNG